MHYDITESFLKKIANNCDQTVILTPNLRLSRFLHQQFDQRQQATQNASWITPTIMPINSWLNIWWSQQNTSFFLLDDNQEYAIWNTIIKRSLNTQISSEIVETAKDAWQLLNKWNIRLESLKNNPIDDISLFYNWAKEFEKILQTKNWCVTSNIIALFLNMDYCSHKLVNLPHKMILVGFEDLSLSPQEQTFFTVLSKQLNCAVEYFDLNLKSSSQKKISFLDQKQEILHMALWANKLWHEDPNQKIGCIVPNLALIRTQVERIFKEIFAQPTTLPFNISIGESLIHCPIINTGLKIISLFSNTKDAQVLSQLLTSPFIAGAETEFNARASLKNKIKEYYQYQFDLKHFLNEAEKTCPIFTKMLHNYLTNFEHTSKNNQPSKWANIFVEQLQLFGWLQEIPLSNVEYQTMQRWQQMLKEFSRLDLTLTGINHQEAIKYLNNFTKKIIFQPKTPTTSINILGTLEAAGLNFDQIWIMGMNEHIFPPANKPNPFLPITLQKKLNLPNSSTERELNFCRNLIERFARSADQIIYSYSQKEDEQDLRVTPLILQVSEIKINELGLDIQQTITKKIHGLSKLEQLIDNTAPPLLVSEKITGGSKLIEQQSLCPFMAFANHRLRAKVSNLGSLKTIRGILIHETLKKIWNLIKNKNELQRFQPQELQNTVNQLLNHSIIETQKNQKILLSDSHLKLEKQCLINLLTNWLAKEQENYGELFFEVINTEKEVEFVIEQITLTLRIDRIDRIEDLGIAIIDYKTGKPKSKPPTGHWTDARPTNIQLPLYCLAIDENIVGLIFAHIHSANMHNKKHLQGWVANEKLKSKGLDFKIEWQKIKTEWQNNLSKLAKEFCLGHALVSPKNHKETCAACEFGMLCRFQKLED